MSSSLHASVSALSTSESPTMVLFKEVNRGFKEGNLELIEKHLHKDFRCFTYPRSLGQPERNREQWLEHFKKIIAFASGGFEMNVHSIIEAPGKVTLHATNGANNSLGIDTTRESIYITHIVPDATGTLKVKQIDEFTDSKVFQDIMQAVEAARPGGL